MRTGKVLIVEDDAAIRRLVATVLGDRGYEIAEAADGTAALQAARDGRPDVVRLDDGLPGPDGFEVLGLLKADAALAAVPVLMVSAWGEPELVTRALDRGAHDYVRKPFDTAELGARVDAAARVKAEHDALAAAGTVAGTIATLDPLTALFDRRQLRLEVERQVALAQRTGQCFSLVRVDVDRLAAVGRDYGEGVGADVLRAAGRRIAALVRRTDVAGRWADGGFLVIAPDTGADGGTVLGEKLRGALCERPLDTPGAAVRATASVGVVTWHGDDAETLLGRCEAPASEVPTPPLLAPVI